MTEEKKQEEIQTTEGQDKKVGDNKLCAILAYLLIGIIWYFVDEKMKKDDYARFHVKQAIVLMALSVAGSIALSVTIFLIWLVPFYQLAIFVLMVIGIYNAYSGLKKELPVIGKFAEKIKI